jgi:TonB family protein
MRSLAVATLLLLAVPTFAPGQTEDTPAGDEVLAGARLYATGNVDEARRHFERALALDPADATTPLLIARALYGLYRPGVDTPENKAVGMEAVAAYEQALHANRAASEPYHAAVTLLVEMGDDELAEKWLHGLANSMHARKDERSVAFTHLAARRWGCARAATDAATRGKELTLADIAAATLCAQEGWEHAERALALDPGNATASGYRESLTRQKRKLLRAGEELSASLEASPRKGEAVEWRAGAGEALAATEDEADPSDLRRIARESGVRLGGMAVNKPAPDYPPEAKAAGAQGTVSVQVNVDEDGRVVSAVAVSGHELLRPAAVAAARRARFAPTLVDGRPAKYTRTISYSFVLK